MRKGHLQEPKPAPDRGLSRARSLVFAVVAIVLFFSLLEGLLALLGFESGISGRDPFVGFATGVPLFQQEVAPDGRRIMVTSPAKRGHFNLQRFASEKPSDAYRVFCLGGSTTFGRPYDDVTSFAGWLRQLLPEADPSRRWEVVNAGGVSYASYRVAELMRELVRYEPDLFVVYSGQNEFLEERTYGRLRNSPAWFRSLGALAARTRTWTAMSSVVRRLRPAGSEPDEGQTLLPDQVAAKLDRAAGLDLYERDDALSENVRLHFQMSLERIVALAESAGAPVLFVVPASNLVDCSPFKSQHTEGLTEAERQRSKELVASARRSIAGERWEDALERLDEARSLDPRFAEIHYLRGRVLLALGRSEEALRALLLASDEDVCPLRALSSLQEIVREVARRTGNSLVDFPALLARRVTEESGRPAPGNNYFLDHVHPTIEGNRLLAVAIVEELAEQGIVRPVESWGSEAVAGVSARVEGSLDRAAHARALGNAAVVLDWAGKKDEAVALARRAVESGVEEAKSLAILARHYEVQGEPEAALRSFRRALLADPQNPLTRFHFALALLARNEPRRAAAHLLFAIAQWPENPRLHQHFGLVMANLGRDDLALASLSRARRLDPGSRFAEGMVSRLSERLGADSGGVIDPVLAVTQHPSGALRTISQVTRGADGAVLRVGVDSEWHENGLPKRYAEYRQGHLIGPVIEWDEGDDEAREVWEDERATGSEARAATRGSPSQLE